MTVSRVVNNGPNVLPETRRRVEEAIAELRYVPNLAARSLAGRGQCRIALLHSNPSAAYLSDFLVGSLEGASQADAQIVVEAWNERDTLEGLMTRLATHRIDAVLLPPPLCDDSSLLAALSGERLPLAQIATARPIASAVAVVIDDKEAARTMASRLVSLGHRRIGFIGGAANQTASALRLAGYEQALRDFGLDVDPALTVEGDFSYRSGLEAAERLLSLEEPPTAIFASNDDMAAAALAVAHRHSLRVPQDLSVVGYDDSAMARTVWPELTTIHQPIAEMARRATLRLAEAFRAKGSSVGRPVHEILPFELVIRYSDGSPRGSG